MRPFRRRPLHSCRQSPPAWDLSLRRLRSLGFAERPLDRLAAAGLRLASDDFGADFSSLARLRDLPVHAPKFDRRGVPGDSCAAAIVTAVVALAEALDLTAVAEGVEQPEFLVAHGCVPAQGLPPRAPGAGSPGHRGASVRAGA